MTEEPYKTNEIPLIEVHKKGRAAAEALTGFCAQYGEKEMKKSPIHTDFLNLVKKYAPEGFDHNIYYVPKKLIATWKTNVESMVDDSD